MAQASRCRAFAGTLSIVAGAAGIDVFLYGENSQGDEAPASHPFLMAWEKAPRLEGLFGPREEPWAGGMPCPGHGPAHQGHGPACEGSLATRGGHPSGLSIEAPAAPLATARFHAILSPLGCPAPDEARTSALAMLQADVKGADRMGNLGRKAKNVSERVGPPPPGHEVTARPLPALPAAARPSALAHWPLRPAAPAIEPLPMPSPTLAAQQHALPRPPARPGPASRTTPPSTHAPDRLPTGQAGRRVVSGDAAHPLLSAAGLCRPRQAAGRPAPRHGPARRPKPADTAAAGATATAAAAAAAPGAAAAATSAAAACGASAAAAAACAGAARRAPCGFMTVTGLHGGDVVLPPLQQSMPQL
jgi:hypothetical protein